MPRKTITAAQLRRIVVAAATSTAPSVSKGRTIRANVQSSIAKVQSAPKAGGTGTVTNR